MSDFNVAFLGQDKDSEDLLYRYSIYLGFTETVARQKAKDFIQQESNFLFEES